MIKIETKGLDGFRGTYLDKVKSRVLDRLGKSDMNKELKDFIVNKIDKILIGNKQELDELFAQLLDFYQIHKEDYLILDFIYTTELISINKLKEKLMSFKSKYSKLFMECVDNLLTKENRRKLLNELDYISYFSDREKIKNVFDYNLIKDLKQDILSKIDVKVCPYCGRQFITPYKKGEKMKTTACLDHYYSKSKYPLFTLSLYNFVPSCYICNSLMKTTKDFYVKKHLYPYEEGFGDDATFGLEGFDIIVDYIKSDSVEKLSSVKIGINVEDCENKEKINNNIATFKLNDVYQTHDDVVKDLLYKIKLYGHSQISQIANLLKLNEQEIEESIFGKPMDDELLGKLKSDILNQYRGNYNR